MAVAFVATGLAVDQFSARYPAPAQLMYALDADTGKAQWVSTDASPGDWTRRYVTRARRHQRRFPDRHREGGHRPGHRRGPSRPDHLHDRRHRRKAEPVRSAWW